MENPSRKILSTNLQRLMAAKGWDTAELGLRAGCGRSALESLLMGHAAATTDLLDRIADLFGVRAADLLTKTPSA